MLTGAHLCAISDFLLHARSGLANVTQFCHLSYLRCKLYQPVKNPTSYDSSTNNDKTFQQRTRLFHFLLS